MSNRVGSKKGVITCEKKTYSFSKVFIEAVSERSKRTLVPASRIIEQNCQNIIDEEKSLKRKARGVDKKAKNKQLKPKQNGKIKK